MTPARSESAIALEEILEKGLLGITEETLALLEARAARSGTMDVVEVIQKIRSNDAHPNALVEVFDSVRCREITNFKPPRLLTAHRGRERSAQVREINVAAGGAEKNSRRRESRGLLDRLSTLPSHAAEAVIRRSSDVSMLWCLVRTGRIADRRAAVRRLGRLIVDGKLEGDGIDERDLIAGLSAIRDPRIAFEADTALATVQGSTGRAARQRLARVDRLLNRVLGEVRRYWTGDRPMDPVAELSREESLRLGVWLRRGSDELAAHMSEHLRQLMGNGEPGQVADAIGALIPSGDERLVPTLCRILADAPLAARTATARALGRIADPRVHPALVKAYRHATDVTEKTVLGGALGQYGDNRALAFLLERLDDDEPAIWEEAVRSLGSIGAEEAASKLALLLDNERSTLVRAASRALIRCGRLEELTTMRAALSQRSQHAGVLSDASDALALRLQLLGALPLDAETSVFRFSRQDAEPALTTPDQEAPTFGRRVQSVGYYLLGLLWSALWQRARALAAFDVAAEINPLAASPHLHVALLQSANNRDDLAIEAYRHALDANKRWVLMRPMWVQRLMRAYLRRADALVARRKKRAALSLLDEIASIDLRLADLDLRLAMTRRRDRLLVDRARRRLSNP